MNSTYKFTLKDEPKVMIKFFLGIKSRIIFLERLKRKVDIFIWIKNIFNHFLVVFLLNISFVDIP